jgi:hypothetical protein
MRSRAGSSGRRDLVLLDRRRRQATGHQIQGRKGKVSMSDWRSRLLEKFAINKNDDNTLRLISDTKDALVAVSDMRVNEEPGTMHEVSIDSYAIDKYTGALTITTAATASTVTEIKGNCAR